MMPGLDFTSLTDPGEIQARVDQMPTFLPDRKQFFYRAAEDLREAGFWCSPGAAVGSGPSRIFLGVSGGLDSILLPYFALYLARRLPQILPHPPCILHFNHGLRPPADQGEARFLRALADHLGLLYEEREGDVHGLAARAHLGTEEAARTLRHGFFASRLTHPGDRLFLAHHADDRAETLLLNLQRGAGLQGLGALPLRRGSIWRPFLRYQKSELEAFAKQAGLDWCEDQTNQEAFCARNRLRLDLIPSWNAMAGYDIRPKITALASEVEDWMALLGPELAEALAACRLGTSCLNAYQLATYPSPLRRLVLRTFVKEVVQDPGFFLRRDQVLMVDRLLEDRLREEGKKKAALDLGGGRSFLLNQGILSIKEERASKAQDPGTRPKLFPAEGDDEVF